MCKFYSPFPFQFCFLAESIQRQFLSISYTGFRNTTEQDFNFFPILKGYSKNNKDPNLINQFKHQKVFGRSAPKSKSPHFCSALKNTVPQEFISIS